MGWPRVISISVSSERSVPSIESSSIALGLRSFANAEAILRMALFLARMG